MNGTGVIGLIGSNVYEMEIKKIIHSPCLILMSYPNPTKLNLLLSLWVSKETRLSVVIGYRHSS